jgi:hypothetical protein
MVLGEISMWVLKYLAPGDEFIESHTGFICITLGIACLLAQVILIAWMKGSTAARVVTIVTGTFISLPLYILFI